MITAKVNVKVEIVCVYLYFKALTKGGKKKPKKQQQLREQDLILSMSQILNCLGLTTGNDRMKITRFLF